MTARRDMDARSAATAGAVDAASATIEGAGAVASSVAIQPFHDARIMRARAGRLVLVFGLVAVAFFGVIAQLVRLGLNHSTMSSAAMVRPMMETFERPDIVDRYGSILATDVVMQSLYADPSRLLGAEETLDALDQVLPGIATPALRAAMADRSRRFVWIRRGLSPATAQQVNDLGLPGLEFRPEPHRSYPQGRLAGHLIGQVNIDNKGTAGIESYIDERVGVEQGVGEAGNGFERDRGAVRLTIGLPAQTALVDVLQDALRRYNATAVSAIVMDAQSGAVRAAASLPDVDPNLPGEAQDPRYLDRLRRGTYELGSIFKTMTIAMGLDNGIVTPRTVFDVTKPIQIGRYRIADHHGAGRPISVEEIFVRSSNVGSGLIALEAGTAAQRAFLKKFGLLDALATDVGTTANPQVPSYWGKAETVTIAYGHGLAVSPLQFAAAGAALVNGGYGVTPKFVEHRGAGPGQTWTQQLISESTSSAIRRMMRLNVTLPYGTGKHADVAGYDVGGKTGTADRAADGQYNGRSVIASFFAAFPISKPRYVVLTTIYNPKRAGHDGMRYASYNAAPTTARIITRLAPLLGVEPTRDKP